MIHVIAPITVADGQREAFLRHFRALVPKVIAEQGCIEYAPAVDLSAGIANQSPQRTNVVTVIEKWANAEALQAHLAAPHMVEFREFVKDLVVSIDLHVLEPA